jgi:sulfur relay (sulfurtransferase) DsrF/TusC family protein
MASLLCIADQGYRASVEEQDDTVVWIAHMLQNNEGTTTALLLRGSAVNYANKAQQSVGVTFGAWKQSHPADFPRDLARFQADGGTLYVLADDLAKRGLSESDLIDGAAIVERSKLGGLVSEYDLVSFW